MEEHALWFYTQIVRWGHVAHTPENLAVAPDCYRPDLYRSALKPLGVALPGANSKVEGALATPRRSARQAPAWLLGPDGFFDGQIFDPDEIDAYIATQKASQLRG